jgi:F5/8 type C domain
MQKRMVHASVAPPPGRWLDVDVLADVELTSEEAAHPVEAALTSGDGSGWRASERGTQSIRLVFHNPQSLRRIRLRFDEADTERTQEFTLRWSPDGGRTFREVVRQQYTFSPAGATSEVEDLNVDLVAVTALELTIIPDQRGGAYASLAEWRLA